ncbi:hypothetical protein FS837_012790 [Tulasnella sp. UAMH 9824]|nr:hypothetical protein FS837_012790 [Tulasnella sp. UAMH 9824]
MSIHYQPSLTYRVASFVVRRPLWLGVVATAVLWRRRFVVDERAEKGELQRRLRSSIYPQSAPTGLNASVIRRKGLQCDGAASLTASGDAIIARQKSRPPGFTESLYTRQSFQAEFESVALKEERCEVRRAGGCGSYCGGIMKVEFGVLQMKTTPLKLTAPQDSGPSSTREQNFALTYLGSKKQLEELLAKRLNTQETLQTVLNKIESAATGVEIMKAYDTSAGTLRAVVQNPLLKQESIDAAMERKADEIEDAISLGNDLAASSAGRLEILIEEQKKEEEDVKERVRLEEKCKTEENEQARVEAEKKRKAKEDGETLRQAEEEVRRKLEEVHVSPETDPRKEQAEKAVRAARDRDAELRMRGRSMRRSSNCLAIHFDSFDACFD